jgi:ABC-type branched-subunit amino acid transport system ATPase component/branched-subunit amino acid ABC-type transport system permease component
VDQYVVFLLLGLANGAVFAALALALVVTYRSSGVINFGTGAIALFSAYVYAFLRQGQLLVPIPGLPETLHLNGGLAFWPAMVVTLAVDALLGLLLYGSTFRPLRTASPVAKAVASIGVMVVITGIIIQRVGTNPVAVTAIFPSNVYTIGSIRVSADRLWFAGTVVLIAGVIIAVYQFTRFGLHTRASAETEKGAYVAGVSPDRIALLNWMISAVVAGLAGILIAPISPLIPYSYTLFIVPALAAAIVGGFDSVAIAVVAGLLIGMLQSVVTYLQARHSSLPQSGLPELVPLLLILLVLVVRAKPLPSRGAIVRTTLARVPRPEKLAQSLVVGGVLGVVVILLLHGSWRAALVTSFIIGIISLSMVVITGMAGQVSLAQLTLAGVAGFLLGPLTTNWHVPFPIAPLLAALGATVIGVIVGLPALRIRGLPVAIVTLSLAVALQAIWFQNIDLVGAAGKTVAEPRLFGLDLGPGIGAAYPRPQFCILVLIVLMLVAWAVAWIRRSSLGSAMLAVRANERSAAASGINVVATKIAAFAIAAFIAGIGGSMLGYKLGTVTFDSFDVLLGLSIFATVYLAGMTSISGGIVAGLFAAGGIIAFAASQWLSLDTAWYTLLTGIGLVITVIKNPEGIVGNFHHFAERRRARRRHQVASTPTTEAGATTERTEPVSDRPATASAIAPSAEPGSTDGPAVLSVRDLSVNYGGVVAVDSVSFDVPRGAIVGLIGQNGAGKTTVIDAVAGFCSCRGSVSLDGTSLDGLKPYRRIRAGLGRTFQGIELWGELTVEENVLVGPGARRRDADEVDALLALLRLDELRHRPASELSQGQRQLVSIARALVAKPTVVLLDEPAAGLDSTESAWLADRLRDLRGTGVTILLVDHDMELVLGLCDRIEVLDIGRIIASGRPEAIRADPKVTEAYLGTSHGDAVAEEVPEVSAG